MSRRARKVRWAHLAEIAHVRKVPTVPRAQRRALAYDVLTNKQKHLATWRFMHVLRKHLTIRKYARGLGVKPSSDISLPQKRKFGYTRKPRGA